MAKKSATKSAPTKKEIQKFANDEAKERYEHSLKGRTLCHEKCFDLSDEHTMGQEQYVWSVILLHNWRKFAGAPHPIAENIVKEFYSHISKNTTDRVLVRGKLVDFSPSAINSFYGLNPSIDGFFDYSEDPTLADMNAMLEDICIPGSKWEGTVKQSMIVKYGALKKSSKIWMQVLKTKLMPSTHCGTITRTRVILLYCIIKNLEINVGEILCGEIRACAKKGKGDLWFPSLITGLCLKSGVPMESNEIENAPILLDKEGLTKILNRQAETDEETEGEGTVGRTATKRKLSAKKKGKSKVEESSIGKGLLVRYVAPQEQPMSEEARESTEEIGNDDHNSSTYSPPKSPPKKKTKMVDSKNEGSESAAQTAAEEKADSGNSKESADFNSLLISVLQKLDQGVCSLIDEQKVLTAEVGKMKKAMTKMWAYEKKKEAIAKAQEQPAFPHDILSEESEEEG